MDNGIAPRPQTDDADSRLYPDEYRLALVEDRRINDLWLKSRFEHIFAKYERDFSGIGDEIDLVTGEIVVNNGHLENIEHETDPGQKESLRFVQAFADELEHEDDGGSACNLDPDVDDADDVLDDDDAESSDGQAALSENENDASDYGGRSSPESSSHGLAPELRSAQFRTHGPLTPSDSPSNDDRDSQFADDVGCSNTEGVPNGLKFDMLDHLPALRDSILALKTTSDAGITEDVLQELGKKIAAEITEAISQGKRDSAISPRGHQRRKDPAWEYPELPHDKLRRTSAKPMSPRARVYAPSPRQSVAGNTSVWASIVPRKRKSTKRYALPATNQQSDSLGDSVNSALMSRVQGSPSLLPDANNVSESNGKIQKACSHCNVTVTSAWRIGPNGDMCNSCGIYYSRYGELRLLESEHSSENGLSPEQSRPKRVHAGPFTMEEDARIIKLKEIDGQTWPEIVKHFPNRSWYSLQGRYSKKLHAQDCPARELLMEQGYSPQIDIYTAREDEMLVELKDEQQLDWPAIAEQMEGHTVDSIQVRYGILSGKYPATSLTERPRGTRQPWTAAEDELLIRSREVDKLSWEDLATLFPSRTIMALQKRYRREMIVRDQIRRKNGLVDGSRGRSELTASFPLTNSDENPDDLIHSIASLVEDMSPAQVRAAAPILEGEEPAGVQYSDPEDQLIMDLRDTHDLDWDMIHLWLPSRSISSIRNRHAFLSGCGETQQTQTSSTPVVANANRPAAETESVYPAIDTFQSSEMANLIVDDITGEVAASYLVSPTKERAVGKGKFTKAEDEAIVRLRGQGLSWDGVQQHFPTTRSVSSIVNRWETKFSSMQALELTHDQPDQTAHSPAWWAKHGSTNVRVNGSEMPIQHVGGIVAQRRRLQTLSTAPPNLFNSLLDVAFDPGQDHGLHDAENGLENNEDDTGFDLLNMNQGLFAGEREAISPIARSSAGVIDVDTTGSAQADHPGQDPATSPSDRHRTKTAENQQMAQLNSNTPKRATQAPETKLEIQSGRSARQKPPIAFHSNLSQPTSSAISSPAVKRAKNARIPPLRQESQTRSTHTQSSPINLRGNRADSIPGISSPCIAESILTSSAGSPPIANFALKRTPQTSTKSDLLRKQLYTASRLKRKRSTPDSSSRTTPDNVARQRKGSSVASMSDRKRIRTSRRRSEIRKLEIPDTDDSDCSWNSDRNGDESDIDENKSVSTVSGEETSPKKALGPSRDSIRRSGSQSKSVEKTVLNGSAYNGSSTPAQTQASSKLSGSISTSRLRQYLTPGSRPSPLGGRSVKDHKLMPGSGRRVVETPVKENEYDSSEDELA